MKSKREADSRKIKPKISAAKLKGKPKKLIFLPFDFRTQFSCYFSASTSIAPTKAPKIEDADESFVEESFPNILGRKVSKPKMEIEVKGPGKTSRDDEYYIHYQQADQNTEKG